MTSSTLRTFLLILILFVAGSVHPSFGTCERMEVKAQLDGIVQGWQNTVFSCVGGSKADLRQICQQTSVVCAETDESLMRPASQDAVKEQEQSNAWVLNIQSESVANTLHLAMSSDFGVVRTPNSFEDVLMIQAVQQC